MSFSNDLCLHLFFENHILAVPEPFGEIPSTIIFVVLVATFVLKIVTFGQ